MKSISLIAAAAAASFAALAAPVSAQAALLGQSFDYCTNSVYGGAVTSDPSSCSTGVVFTQGSASVIDPGVEVVLDQGGVRRVDFTDTLLQVIYEGASSPSADLFVFTGFENIAALTLISSNPLDLTWTFTADSIGVLVNSPLENGTVTLQVTTRAVVPEPATWAMMIMGFGAAGAALRQARRKPMAVRA